MAIYSNRTCHFFFLFLEKDLRWACLFCGFLTGKSENKNRKPNHFSFFTTQKGHPDVSLPLNVLM